MKELFVLAFIVSTPSIGNTGNENDAYKAVSEASYKQSGLENMINNYVQKELRHVPKELQTVVGNSYLVGKMIVERKAVYTWNF